MIIDENIVTLAKYGVVGICIYFGGIVTAVYSGMAKKSIGAFVLYLAFLVIIISIPFFQSIVEKMYDKERITLFEKINGLNREKESLNDDLSVQKNQRISMESELSWWKSDKTYDNPRIGDKRVDVCIAGDDDCIKNGNHHGEAASLKWCNERGYLKVRKFDIAGERTKSGAWRIGGNNNNICLENCSYLESIVCGRL